MTRLFVDHREIPLPPIGITSLEDVVRHVESFALEPNALIRDILLDGDSWAAGESADEGARLAKGISGNERIEVFTGSIPEVAREAIREALLYLDRVEAITPSIASSFQICPGPEAFSNLGQMCEGFRWLNLLVDRLASLYQVDLSSTRIEGESLKQHHEQLASILARLVEAQEQEKFGVIADLLERGILPFIPTWRSIFRILLNSAV